MHQRPGGSSRNSLIAARSALVRAIYDLNLFSHNPFWSPSLNFSEQILSTRLFLLFLFLSLLIVITYASLIIRTHSVTLTHFSLSNFEDLHSRSSAIQEVPVMISLSFDRSSLDLSFDVLLIINNIIFRMLESLKSSTCM